MFLPATFALSDTSNNYISVNASGQIACANAEIGKLIFINATYKV